MSGIADVVDRGQVTSLFQPVVDLDSGEVCGYEALTRGPEGPLHRPDDLFAEARAAGVVSALDWLCRGTAIATSRAAGVRFPLSVLINAEPETLLADQEDLSRWGAFSDLRCYCEVTERAIARQPGRLTAALDQIRAQDWGVALDDVGVDPGSLALLPLLKPDIIKLDAGLLRPPTTASGADVARTVHAVVDQAGATGAAVIAEGIEDDADLDLARAYGVRYGQGYRWGRPGPLPSRLPSPSAPMPLLPRLNDRATDPGPFAVLAAGRPLRAITRASLVELVRQLLVQAATLVPEPAVLLCSPVALDALAPGLADLLDALDRSPHRPPVLGLLGAPQRQQEVSPLPADDPAGADLAVAVVTPHFAAAVAARPNLRDPSVFDGGLTMDRELVTAVAGGLLSRLR